MKTYTAKTVDECLAAASSELGIAANDLVYVVTEEKKTLFKKTATISVYEHDDAAKFGEEYLISALKGLGIEATASSVMEDDIIKITLESERNPVLIGKAGRTLQALNELVKLAVSNKFRHRYRILLDVGGYKEDKYDRVARIAKRNAKAVHGILVEGLDNCLIKFSRCCTPVPGDDIIGFITRGQGVSIHRKDCQNYRKRDTSPENEGRWIKVEWADTISDVYTTTITISSKDRNGLVMDIATVLNSMNAKVRNLSSRSVGYGQAVTVITLEVKNATELRYIMNRIAGVAGVSSVMRNGN